MEDCRILCESYRPRRDRYWTGEQRLPEKEKGEQPPRTVFAECMQQKIVWATRIGETRAELRPHEAITQRQRSAQYPPEHCLRTSHGRQCQRDGEERSNAHHVEHVGCYGAPQAHASIEVLAAVSRLRHENGVTP